MEETADNTGFEIEQIVDLLIRCHTSGSFIRDPNPQIITRTERGQLQLDESHLEKRSHADVAALTLAQLWPLMHGESTRRKIMAGQRYLRLRKMEGDVDEALRSFTDNYVGRCFHDNCDFQTLQVGSLIWHVRRDRLTDAHRPILEDPDRFLLPGAKLLKDSNRSTVAETPGQSILKRFNLKKVSNLLKNKFSRSRARQAFKRGYHLETLGIPTPCPIAYAEQEKLGWPYRSFLLQERLADAVSLDEAFRKWDETDREMKRASIARVGRIVGLLHDSGFANRDLKATNLMVDDVGGTWVIDLDGIRVSERVNAETRLKNLRRMTRDIPSYGELSIRDRMLFLKSYVRCVQKGSAAQLFRELGQEEWR